MKVKRAVMMAVLVVAVAALALPMLGLKAGASAASRPSAGPPAPVAVEPAAEAAQPPTARPVPARAQAGRDRVSPELLESLGIAKSSDKDASSRIAQAIKNRLRSSSASSDLSAQSGQPVVLNAQSALSAALMTNIGGRDNQFSEVALVADWDGREDCAADREQKVDDFSNAEVEIDFHLTRTGISEHTFANGFTENVYYYGDSVGNFWVGTDANPQISAAAGGAVDTVLQLNIPELVNTGGTGPDVAENAGAGNGIGDVLLLNPGGTPVGGTAASGDCTDDQVNVSGIAVNPVSDLGDFGAAFCGVIGEVVYVSVYDAEGCASNASNQIFRTRIFAFGFVDGPGGLVPIGAIQILRNPLHNVAGVSVDDDSNLYFQLVDLINTANGGAIFKVTEACRPVAGCPGPRINRVISSIPGGLDGSIGLTSARLTATTFGVSAGGYRLTNYTGPSTVFGNIVAIDNGPCNVLWAAVAASANPASDQLTQATQGPFAAPSAFGSGVNSGLPSMIISFADCGGATDLCSGAAELAKPDGRVETIVLGGGVPVADGFADPASAGLALNVGVNNFRVFATGNGPDIRPATGATAVVPGTPGNLLRIAPDFQIDFSTYSGINVSEEGTVFVISGGHPAGTGKNSSLMLGEILCFEDMCPMDRRADPVDLRTTGQLPNPPASGGNVGDGVSDRFDHIFYQAPLDAGSQFTPAGLSGLARGFLRYTNRLAPRGFTSLSNPVNGFGSIINSGLGVTTRTQGDDSTTGQIIFEAFDPGHQVAGGDDQNTPFRGDDSDGLGVPSLDRTLLWGGFEFNFLDIETGNCVWNGFWLGSNGIIGFGATSPPIVASNQPFVPAFRQDAVIAPAWTDLNPASRAVSLCTFPVQALGFANINAFKIRWINVPEFGFEVCSSGRILPNGQIISQIGGNTFAVTLYDDGTGVDENSNEALSPVAAIGNNVNDGAATFDKLEGPTDLRFTLEPTTNTTVGCPPRPEGSGIFLFEYCQMTLLGTAANPVLVGFSVGLDPGTSPPGICEINLSTAARDADTAFGVIQGQTAAVGCNCLIGEGTEPTLFEFFNGGQLPGVGADGSAAFATPDFDLRFEGNDPTACQPARQGDANRGKVGFRGVGCRGPQEETILCPTGVFPVGTVAVAPGQPAVGSAAAGTPTGSPLTRRASGTAGIINAICSVQLNILGCGFFPLETTTICPGFTSETGVPQSEPGKTVSTAVTILCDANADGIVDTSLVGNSTLTLTNVTTLNCNLIRATLTPPTASVTSLPGTPFPAACCGGFARLAVTTTFSAGRNNVFGAFTRTATCDIDLGLRAPVIFSVSPSDGNCAVPIQNLTVTGACFIINGVPNVTSVFAVQSGNTSNVIGALGVKVLSSFLLDAEFNFGSANAGRRFFIFATGPNGTSQNLTSLPVGSAGCPAGFLGNQQGIQVSFTCNSSTTPDAPTSPLLFPVINGCRLNRDDTGTFTLDVFGSNIRQGPGFAVTVGGVTPRKVKFREADLGNPGVFRRITLKGRICSGLAGAIVVTNPPSVPGLPGLSSQPFACTERCPAN
jgi:hypothetical protein